MRRAVVTSCVILGGLAWGEGEGRAQPKVELPPDEPQRAVPKPDAIALPRENQIEVPLSRAAAPGSAAAATSSTGIGGYGEIVLNAPIHLPGDHPVRVDVRRLVLYFGHNFTERLRLYSEVEIEHAIASSKDQGEVEVEQVFLDYLAWRPLNFRAGLIVMPVGIVNVYHEPPMFNGADRPDTDLRIIPSTWREVGAGIFGGYGPVRYQLYGVTGFAAAGFTAAGLRDGHQEGQLARAKDWAGVLRVDWEPILGMDVGVSLYRGNAGQADPALQLPGKAIPGVALSMIEVDGRLRWKGLEVRAEFANVWIGDTQVLSQLLAMQMSALPAIPGPVATEMRGGYGEVGYNVFHFFHWKYSPSLVAFGRYERTNTQAAVPAGFARAVGSDRQVITAGLTFRPLAEVAVKLDYQHHIDDAEGGKTTSYEQLNAGLGFMY